MLYLLLTWLAAPVLFLRTYLVRRENESPHILVMQTAKIGDMICSTPVFREIKRNFPNAKLTVLCTDLTAPLLKHNPHVDTTMTVNTKELSGISGKRKFIRLLVSLNIDMSICLSPNLTFLLAPLWAKVPVRASVLPNFFGTTYVLARHFLTHSSKHQQGRLFVETVFLLLEKLGCKVSAKQKEVFGTGGATQRVNDLLASAGKGKLIGIGISSGNKLKALKPETLQEIIQMILLKTDSTIVLIGAANDACEGAMLMEKFSRQRVINGAGAFSLVELPELLMRLTLFVSVDSGIAYMADAVNIPVIDIMGPADPSDQRPTGANAIIIKTELPCAPCSHAFRAPYECKIKTRACVNNVDAQRIVGEVIASLVKAS